MDIVLCCMVKQESQVIVRLLDSVKPIVSGVSITDTGSTDNTCELIEKWGFDNNIPTVISYNKWINFGVSRTNSLINAKRTFPEAKYFLLLDADMILRIDNFNSSKLKKDEYRIEQKNNTTCYYNTRLISSKKDFRCVGGTHEYWSCPTSVTHENLNSLKIDDMNDGGSRHDKYERDKNIMLGGLRKNITPDYLRNRYYFYLGQTYQGKCNFKLSNFWYKKRIESGGWDQETYYSIFQVGENYQRNGNFMKALFYYSKAWNFRPSRAEPVLGLAQVYRKLGMKSMSKLYIELGRKIPKPDDILFLDISVYEGTKFIQEMEQLNIS